MIIVDSNQTTSTELQSQLSKQEVDTYQLMSDYGDLYEGYVLRIRHEHPDREKYVLFLASTFHTNVKLASIEEWTMDDPAQLDARLDSVRILSELFHSECFFLEEIDY